jgi:hypothetical protein
VRDVNAVESIKLIRPSGKVAFHALLLCHAHTGHPVSRGWNSNTCFLAPTLARKIFASNTSLAGFPIGASFGSTNVISLHRREHATSSSVARLTLPRLSHDTGHRCRKSGVSDRHGRSLWANQSFNLGTELLRERLDDARTEPGFWLSKDAVRLANPIVSD